MSTCSAQKNYRLFRPQFIFYGNCSTLTYPKIKLHALKVDKTMRPKTNGAIYTVYIPTDIDTKKQHFSRTEILKIPSNEDFRDFSLTSKALDLCIKAL